jgi:hypothetical protein
MLSMLLLSLVLYLPWFPNTSASSPGAADKATFEACPEQGLDKAIADYSEAIRLNANAGETYCNRGNVQEQYTLRFKEANQGESYRKQYTQLFKYSDKVMNQFGQTLGEENGLDFEGMDFTETIIKKTPGQLAERLSRTYAKASATRVNNVVALPLEGKTVLIERKGKKAHFRHEDGIELTTEEGLDLYWEFINGPTLHAHKIRRLFDKLLPKGPVQCDESWSIDSIEFCRAFIGEVDDIGVFLAKGNDNVNATKTKSTGKLAGVYQKDNKQFGKIGWRLELYVKENAEVGCTRIKRNKTVINMTYDGCIDGSCFSGTLRGVTDFQCCFACTTDGIQVDTDCEGSVTFEEVTVDVGTK